MTRTLSYVNTDGSRDVEAAATTAERTSASGALRSSTEDMGLALFVLEAQGTVRDAEGRLLAVTPAVDVGCPWW